MFMAENMSGAIPGAIRQAAVMPLTDSELARVRWPRICATCVQFGQQRPVKRRGHQHTWLTVEGYCGESDRLTMPNDDCHIVRHDRNFQCRLTKWLFYMELIDNYSLYLARGGRDFRAGSPSGGRRSDG